MNSFIDLTRNPENSKMPIMKLKVNVPADEKEQNTIYRFYNSNV